MDLFMSVLFFIMFLIVIGVIIYLVYDYIDYKSDVDNSLEITTHHINDSFDKVSKNINTTEKKLSDKMKKDVIQMKMANDELDTKVQNVDGNIQKMDSALKKYMAFYDNNESINNKKIYDYVFSDADKKMQLMTQVDTYSGMTIVTPEEMFNDKNLKICDETHNCMHLNTNSDGFNIVPDNNNNLTIYSTSQEPLARFDLQNNSIYFGGTDVNAPMFIRNQDLYINNVNLILKDTETLDADVDLETVKQIKIKGQDVNVFTTANNNRKIYDILDTKQIIIYYNITSLATGEPAVLTNTFTFKIISTLDLLPNDKIKFQIPIIDLGQTITVTLLSAANTPKYTITGISPSTAINVSSGISVVKQANTIDFELTIAEGQTVDKNTPLQFVLSGQDLLSASVNKSDILTGILNNNQQLPLIRDMIIPN